MDRLHQDADREAHSRERRFKGPGGTPGGSGSFLVGLAMTIAGGYLLLNQVQVTGAYWLWWGRNTFGLTLIPLIVGIGWLFYNGKSLVGWLLAAGGVIIVFTGVLSNLHLYYRQTSLFDFLLMIILFVGGLGLIARSLKSRSSETEE